MRLLFIFISLFAFGFTQAQTNVFQARFRSLQNGEPVLYAKITNAGGQHKLTNINGYVSIEHSEGEELVISHLIYDTLRIKTSNWIGRDSLVFYLQPRTYDLKEVKFTILGERSLFDNKFVKNDLGKSDEDKVREKLNINEMKQELIGLDRSAQGGMVLGSPITFLYNRFSKSGKERTKYLMLLEKDRLAKIKGKKFDDLIINTLTNYEAEELAKFKEFCSFHPTYIDAVDALQLYFEILRCRDEYVEKEI
ncbi:MAG: hypothetical protein COA58_12155 [Bacteroidetes bacterium]|nr:MAG: hypothetical protein COA58_12155 [Bacteroidota bacterium]